MRRSRATARASRAVRNLVLLQDTSTPSQNHGSPPSLFDDNIYSLHPIKNQHSAKSSTTNLDICISHPDLYSFFMGQEVSYMTRGWTVNVLTIYSLRFKMFDTVDFLVRV